MQRQLADIIIKNEELCLSLKRFIQRVLRNIEECSVVLSAGLNNVLGVLQLSCFQAKVLSDHLNDLVRLLVGVDVGVFVLEVAELIVGRNLNEVRRPAGPALFKHETIKNIRPVDG